jgi:hypothetical protein
VKEILSFNGSIPANPTINTLGSGFTFPDGVAVDGKGNVFVADQFNNYAVEEMLAVNGSVPANPTINVLSSSFYKPGGVAVDGAGDVFVADTGHNEVKEILAVDGSIPAKPTINAVSSGSQPAAVALDGRGDVFVSVGGGNVVELQRSQPPALSFAATVVGNTSADSPQSVILQNIGNATLTGNGVLSATVDFVRVAGPGIVSDCTLDTLSLPPGAECNLSFDFTPQSLGPQSATLALSDNTLNGDSVTQPITFSGTGVSVLPPTAQVSTTLQFGFITFPGPETLPLTITNVGGGTLTVSPSIGGPSYTISGSTCTGGVTAGNSCALQVQFGPVTIGSHVDILTLQTNGSTNPTVTLHGFAFGVGTTMEPPLQFGTIAFGTTKVLPLTITNIGTSGTITVGTKINGPSYKVLTTSQNTCLAGIIAYQSCTLPIEFDPVSVGMHDDILTLTPSGGLAATKVHLDGVAN